MNNKFLSRFSQMLSNNQLDSLLSKKIILFGVGGVGGAVAEMLVRSGVSNLTIVDFDVIDTTNINRQIIATNSTVGLKKVVTSLETLPPFVLKTSLTFVARLTFVLGITAIFVLF